jgi:hypothetical protein
MTSQKRPTATMPTNTPYLEASPILIHELSIADSYITGGSAAMAQGWPGDVRDGLEEVTRRKAKTVTSCMRTDSSNLCIMAANEEATEANQHRTLERA